MKPRASFGRSKSAVAVRWLTATAYVLMGGGPAWSNPGDLLWEDRFGARVFEQAFSVAADHGRVFVAGWTGFPRPGDARDFLVRSYDARTGELLWQDQVNRGSSDFAAGVVTEGKQVFVSGRAGSFSNQDWLVRAYDGESGTLLWEDRFDRSGGADGPRPDALAVSEGRLFVVGMADNFDVWVLRAYDTATGQLIWQDQRPAAQFGFANDESVVAVKGRVFVAGFFDTTNTSSDLLIRGHDAATGTLLWQHRTQGPLSDLSTMRGLASDGKHVFAAGSIANASGKNVFLVQAYDAETGAILWQDQVDKGGDFDAAYRITVKGHRVFAGGSGGRQCLNAPSPPSDCNALLRTYESKTGALLWEREVGGVGVDDGFPPEVLAHNGAVILATTVSDTTNPANLDWFIQAYDSATGQPLWEDRRDAGGGDETPLDLVLRGGRLFVVGRAVDATNNWDFTVRAYDAGDDE